jgi:hypothetical protein
MPEFWVASGHHLTTLDRAGRMVVTDELLLAWLARPEIVPPPEACATERAVHARLLQGAPQPGPRPRTGRHEGPGRARELALLPHAARPAPEGGHGRGGYAAIMREGLRLPVVFLSQLVQLILRNALDGCDDPQVLRAAECLFRPQRAHVKDGVVLLADEELVRSTRPRCTPRR